MHKIFNDLFAPAILKEIFPLGLYCDTFNVVMDEWIFVKIERWSAINIE